MLSTPAAPPRAPSTSGSSCALGPTGAVQHVVYIQFDNTHFQRDNPNVASDIEQMPPLLHFMEGNGTVLPNDHTPLIGAHRERPADLRDRRVPGPAGDRRGQQLPVLPTERDDRYGRVVFVLDRPGWTATPPPTAAFDYQHIPRPAADRLIAEGRALLHAAQELAR